MGEEEENKNNRIVTPLEDLQGIVRFEKSDRQVKDGMYALWMRFRIAIKLK